MAKKVVDTEKGVKNLKKGASEFKDFISRGNVVDMAVGVIIGGAFGKIVTSLVDDILMPIIGAICGGLNFTDLAIKIGNARITYGIFIQSVVDFLIVAFCIFLMIKMFERFKKKEEEEEPTVSDEAKLLEEIRDLMKNQK